MVVKGARIYQKMKKKADWVQKKISRKEKKCLNVIIRNYF